MTSPANEMKTLGTTTSTSGPAGVGAKARLAIRTELTVSRKPRPEDRDLVFGRVFTDHMAVADWTEEGGWSDPRVVPYGNFSMDPASAVFHYGQEIFDGLKAYRASDGRVQLFRADRHSRRLAEGAPRLCMTAPDPALTLELLIGLVSADRDWVPASPGTSLYIRPTLIATEPFLGVRPSKKYMFFIIASPVGAYHSGSNVFSPARIWVEDRFVRAAAGGLGAVKAGANYAASLLAAEEAKKRGYDQVLWTDASEHRHLEEVGTMNLVAVIGDELITPALDGTILGGVTRDSVLTLCKEWGVKTSERQLTIDELLAAQRDGSLREVFGCGTAAVITPVGELGWKGEKILINGGQPGELAQRLYTTITDVQYGRVPDTHGWMTLVP
ncbi:MAG TPA: branched-chain amino acid aminotransferase [Polyangia bacterium]